MKCRIFRLSSSLEAFALPDPLAVVNAEGVHTWWILWFPIFSHARLREILPFEAGKFWPVLHGHSTKFQSASPGTIATIIHLAYFLSH